MNPEDSRDALACYAKGHKRWPTVKEWNRYACQQGFLTARTLSYLGIWDEVKNEFHKKSTLAADRDSKKT
ncbi:MAG: hypothetical protein E6X17_06540 [Sporomusaceae bacterium]|nr:hypothetical protein [Sporomusaceae bacterium]